MALAPIDAKVTFKVEGDEFTLRLNFRALTLAKKAGVNLMSGGELDPLDMAVAVRCLAVDAHPDMTDEDAFALIVSGGEAVGKALAELFNSFGQSAGGKGKAKPRT